VKRASLPIESTGATRSAYHSQARLSHPNFSEPGRVLDAPSNPQLISVDLMALEESPSDAPYDGLASTLEPSLLLSEMATLRLDLPGSGRMAKPTEAEMLDVLGSHRTSLASQPQQAALHQQQQSPAFYARETSLAGSSASRKTGLAGASELGSEGLTQAITAYGAPSEWWHDSIILGRLSALALRYFAAKAARRPYQAWRSYARQRRSRKIRGLRLLVNTCTGHALRSWRWEVLANGRLANKMPLINALQLLPAMVLRPTWAKLQQSVFLRRDLSRRLRLLCLVERKMLAMLARTHYYQHLMRLGIAGLWLASQVRINTRNRSTPDTDKQGLHHLGTMVAGEPSRSHVSQVLRRAWRRWFFGMRMWLSNVDYNMRETEAWLSGEITTPRSIVTSNAMQVISPETRVGGQGGLNTSGFLGYGGMWNLGNGTTDPTSPAQASMFEEPQLQLPFPSAGLHESASLHVSSPGGFNSEASSPMMHLESSSRHDGLSIHGHSYSRAKPRPMSQRSLRLQEEKELALPPTRTRRSLVFEATREAAEQATMSRYRQDEQARDATKSWNNEAFGLGQHVDYSAPSSARTGDGDRDTFSSGHNRQRPPSGDRLDMRRRSEVSEVDHMEFVEPEDAPFDDRYNRSGRASFEKAAHQAEDAGVDYWAMRSRIGPAHAPRAVTLRQRS